MKRILSIIAIVILFAGILNAQPGAGIDSNAVDYTTPRQYEIGGIKIVGAEGIDDQVIINRSGLAVNSVISIPGDDIAQAVRKIWEMGLFSDIEIKIERQFGKTVFLLIELQERPRLSRYTITGVRKSAQEEFRGKFNLRRGDPITEFDKSTIRNTVSRYYADKGYLNADADIVIKADTAEPNAVVAYIHIDKGEKVRINEIEFIGNESTTERQLRSVMKDTKERTKVDLSPESFINEERKMGFFEMLGNISYNNLMSFLDDHLTIRIFNSSKYLPSTYKADKQKIIEYYNSLGYRDATIVSDTVYHVDPSNLNISMRIEEGQKYYFRNIAWEGNTKYSDAFLNAILNIEKGELYNQAKLQQKLFFDPQSADVSSIYMDDGYLFFSVTPEETRVVNDSIDITIQIYEGPQATIDEIIIKGNEKTKEHVIRRELRTVPGEKFSRSELIRSQREIAALGYFDPEQIGILPLPSPEDGTVDIEYTVVEKPSDQLELSAGWGGAQAGLYGSAGISFNNFSLQNIFDASSWQPLPSGDGQKLSFRLQTRGKFLQSYTFSFTEPWLGGKKPNSLTFSFNYTLYNPSNLNRDNEFVEYIITRGGTVVYGNRLRWPDDYFVLYSSLNIQNYYLRNYDAFEVANGNVNNLSIKETLARNSSGPNPLYPTSGSNVSLSLQLTPPYSLFDKSIVNKEFDERYKWLEFHKWRFNADWFTSLSSSTSERPFVLKVGARFGFVGYYNEDLGVSPFERFRVGGDGLSGGFTLYGYDIISLRGTESEFLPVGAAPADGFNAPIFNKFNVELRYPVSLSQASTIYAMLFLEGGNSYVDFEHYNPFKLRRSAGLGVRLYLPMFGLLGFDYGIELDKNTLEGRTFGEILGSGAFHFKLGFEPE